MVTTEKSRRGDEKRRESAEDRERTAARQGHIAAGTTQGLHIAEDLIYALTALLLAGGSLIVLAVAVYHFATDVSKGVEDAIEATLNSLLIVFILVELLAAVRQAIDEHQLVAEPFLLVGILAAIKEMVVVSTFRIESQKTSDAVLKIGVLAAVVIGLAIAILVLRRKMREPSEEANDE
ncbi:MAG TPA: phosphate-starvation-inducible PsiE family protein [Acidimicrobiales bacterium]|nr:phosphate-starvation-inducible PsiE family protein [Acidimicrobiales bacterium]